MAEELPQRPVQHVIGDRALALVKLAVPKEWIVREQGGDYGIDLELELSGKRVSGQIFKGQVKGHATLEWTKAGTRTEQIRQSTIAYWRELAVPVIVFSVETDSGSVYWAPVAVDLAASGDVLIRQTRKLPESAKELALHVLSWRDAKSHRAALDSIPLLAERFNEKLNNDLNYDAHLPLERHQIDITRELYTGLVRLRDAVGLTTPEMFPWQLWLARSKLIFGNAEPLFWGVHDELVLYMKPLFEEAIAKAKTIIEAEEITTTNVELKEYFSNYRALYIFDSPLDKLDDAFWSGFEKILEKSGALKFTKKR